jgi:hypothetical protein
MYTIHLQVRIMDVRSIIIYNLTIFKKMTRYNGIIFNELPQKEFKSFFEFFR